MTRAKTLGSNAHKWEQGDPVRVPRRLKVQEMNTASQFPL